MQVLRLQMFHRQLISHTVIPFTRLLPAEKLKRHTTTTKFKSVLMMSHWSMSNLHYYREASVSKDVLREIIILPKQSLFRTGLILQESSASSLAAAPFASWKDLSSAIWEHPFPQSASSRLPCINCSPPDTQISPLPFLQDQPNKCKQ